MCSAKAASFVRAWRRINPLRKEETEERWSPQNTGKYLAERRRGTLLDDTAEGALKLCFSEGLINKNALLSYGQTILQRQFSIFQAPVPPFGDWPWGKDWRSGVCADEKFPRELSRLWFLLPLLQNAVIAEGGGDSPAALEAVFQILRDFRQRNPCGHGLAWNAMDVSLRTISLVALLDMAVLCGAATEQLHLLLEMTWEHGAWLWDALEDAEAGGCEYAAHLTALLAAGSALSGSCDGAETWRSRAETLLSGEIQRQFSADGVHAEKSTDYHRLATELFLLARIFATRRGGGLTEAADKTLHTACRYAAHYLRPDGLAPIVGDAEDARPFGFDPAPPRFCGALLSLGAVVYEDAALKSALMPQTPSLAIPWLLGESGVETWRRLPDDDIPGSRYFAEGGIVSVREKNACLLMNVGDKGPRGHNDILSFELCLEGYPVLVDPGCPTQAGAPIARALFRSAAYHNALVVDGKEPAGTEGRAARPHSVSYGKQGGTYTITAGHDGYRTLETSVDVLRTVTLDAAAGTLSCRDELTADAVHKISRTFHFSPEVMLYLKDRRVFVNLHQFRFEITFDEASQPYILNGRVSNGYGHTADAPILMLSTVLARSQALAFFLRKT